MDKAMNGPLISVLLPVYNAEKYVVAAIESILAQDYPHFELLIINDGSNDASEALIKRISDPRIVYTRNESNLGLIATLNKGIDQAKGKYIARMDADDVSLLQRFSKQIALLENHPATAVCGTSFYSWKEDRKTLKVLPTDADEIKAELLFRSVIAHPSAMLRKEMLDQHQLRYSENAAHAEDYELWTRIVKIAAIENIAEPLLLYREHEQQVTKTKLQEKESTRHKVMFAYLSWLGLSPSVEEREIHLLLSEGRSKASAEFLSGAEAWLKKIGEAGEQSRKIDAGKLKTVLHRYWLKTCENSGLGWKAKKIYTSSPLAKGSSLSLRSRLKLYYKLMSGYRQH